MPRYEYLCNCENEPKVYIVSLSFNEYEPEIPCPCGKGKASRKFSSFSVQQGLTSNEKKFGTTNNRKQMADFMKDQKQVRKTSYDPDSRESKSNEIWLGKEGLDGITSMPIERKKD